MCATSILLVLSSLAASGAQAASGATPDVQVLFQQLQDESTTNEAAGKLAKLARENPGAREYLAVHLPKLIKDLPELAEKMSQDPAQAAVANVPGNILSLAGELKLKEVVPALISLLPKTDTAVGTTTMAEIANLDNDPIGKTLARIGDPSVGPVARLLEKGDINARERAMLILLNINSPAALQALRSHIPKEQDPKLREWLLKRVGSAR